jgi:GGDEF domain-containing protein
LSEKIQNEVDLSEQDRTALKYLTEKVTRSFQKNNRDFQEVVEQLREEARRDPLTKLLNGPEFAKLTSAYLSIAKNGYYVLGVIDVRDFKKINDTYGHAFGNKVLLRMGNLIGARIRTSCQIGDCKRRDSSQCDDCIGIDLRGRWGGDEFVFLITSFSDLKEVRSVVDRFRTSISEDEELREIGVQVDLGVVAMLFEERSTMNKDELFSKAFAQADELMYLYKSRSKLGQSPEIPIAEWTINGQIRVINDPK